MQYAGIKGVVSDSGELLAHLAEVLESPAFRSSHRSCQFLRYVVETTLAGQVHLLKERTIGEIIYGRPPDYDTGQDSIVRVKANEVRRRLAQYYDLHPNSPVRIELPAGSYAPHFQRGQFRTEPETPVMTIVSVPVRRRWSGRRWMMLALVPILFGGIALWSRYSVKASLFQTFWEPFFAAGHELRICIPTPETYRIYGSGRDALVESFRPRPPGELRPKLEEARLQGVQIVPESGFFLGLGDAHAMALLSTFAAGRGKTAQIRHGNDTTFTELRAGPNILLGGFTNRWTLDLMKDARFTFASVGADYGIRDQTTGKFICQKQRSWESPHSEDCAVVTRSIDSKTGHPLLLAGGLDHFGTYAVGEFLTRADRLEPALRTAKGWETKNLQIVFRIEIMRDNIGPPRVLATHLW